MRAETIIEKYKKATSDDDRNSLANDLMLLIIRTPTCKQWKFVLNDIDGEVWTPIVWPMDFTGYYEISNFGRLKSVARYRETRYGSKLVYFKERTTQWKHGRKYPHTNLTMGTNDKVKILVHIVVAKHFVSNSENKPWVNHIDGDPSNNHYSNLEWCTAKENNNHARRIGLNKNIGEGHALAKINDKDAMEIFNSSINSEELSKKYGISASNISKIKSGATWGHLTGKKHVSHRMIPKDVIVNVFKANGLNKEIAKKYGISSAMVGLIKRRKGRIDVTNNL